MTSARDPGVVPRASHPPEEEFSYDTSTHSEIGGRHTPSLTFPRIKEVMVNGVPVKVKYCDTCMIYRPPRCSHCSICNNSDNRVSAFDRGCLSNFIEVLCTEIKPSRNKFRAYVQDEIPRPPPVGRARNMEEEPASSPRVKVEDDLDIGGDLLKISRRRNYEEVDEEMGGRNSNGLHQALSESELMVDSETEIPVVRTETKSSSRGRRSGSWDLSPGFLAASSLAAEGDIPSSQKPVP
ncbi:hypothetical protein BHE74_00049289 [Ensete ventricosum]|nr:hypothetical protein BHE74_00049289 [Ensete ventricosum]